MTGFVYLVWYVLQLEGQVVAMLVQNLERLDENVKEEADGVHNTLGGYEHSLSSLYPPQAKCFGSTDSSVGRASDS